MVKLHQIISEIVSNKGKFTQNFPKHFLVFPENGFNFATKKLAQIGKTSFSNCHSISFSLQGSFKTTFENGSPGKI